jgi:hypothetical protein
MAENVVDSWEELEDSGELDRKFEKLVLQSTEVTEETRRSPITITTIPVLQEECGGRTAYQPTVRILKRDRTAEATNAANNVVIRTKPTRTLQEREAAYAEARLRILGSAVSNDEDPSPVDDLPCLMTDKKPVTRAVINSDSMTSLKDCNVLRQPRGPDGSNGFLVTR